MSTVYAAALASEMRRIAEFHHRMDDQAIAPIRDESQIRLSRLALEIMDAISER